MEPVTLKKNRKKTATKVVFTTHDDRDVEAVFVQRPEKNIVCLSTQIGCPMACRFCRAGRFVRNLTADELVVQTSRMMNCHAMTGHDKPLLYSAMGVGEPTLNPYFSEYVKMMIESGNRLAFATMVPKLEYFVKTIIAAQGTVDPKAFKVQLSLHAVRWHVRGNLFGNPAPQFNNLLYAVEHMFALGFSQDQIELNFMPIMGINDTALEAVEVARYFKGMTIKLTQYNPIGTVFFKPSAEKTVARLAMQLRRRGMVVERYRTDGASIQAACGQLLGGNYAAI